MFTKYRISTFGPSKTGLSNVAYRLIDKDGNLVLTRTTGGVSETIVPGTYGANVTGHPDNFEGIIVWDTGEPTGSIVYAVEDLHPDWDTGAGAYTVTITVETTGNIGISGVLVTIKNSDESLTLRADNTNSSGSVLFNLNSGDYKVVIRSSALWETLSSQSLTISGNTNITYNLQSNVVTPPVDPSVCRIYGYTSTIGGLVEQGVKFQFKLVTKGHVESGGRFVKVTDVGEVESDVDGFFYIDLIPSANLTTEDSNSLYRVVCANYKMDEQFTCPTGTTADLITLI